MRTFESRFLRKSGPWTGVAAVLVSLIVQNIGAAFAKQLFSTVGAAGMTALRIGIAACLLIVMRRAWRRMPTGRHLPVLLVYGSMLGLMNVLIYQAFSRIPIGIAIAIEVLGPLSVVLCGARRPLDLAWLVAAGLGLWLLLPISTNSVSLDPVGIAFAAGAAGAWALYVVYGKQVARFPEMDAVAWGMALAAAITVPLGAWSAGSMLLVPSVLAIGLVVAVLSSAVPYTLEMWALRRLSTSLFGVLLGSSPAVAALAGYIILGETLSSVQWMAIASISIAVMGSTLTPGERD
ncbi:EamA family transporter [Xanthomonas citri]|uniref:EamA family transporter n=1 Tax=Xanthomonas citri TaxID=346 RepID=UPI00052FDAA1|nr:EamA family transporter [Xanthomonas citri]QRD56591.1 EamA family transporter [Xanthomonas citri pv. citri]CEH75725.1 Inner membrane transporter RhtA [Xanthomonas citri pv. citri]